MDQIEDSRDIVLYLIKLLVMGTAVRRRGINDN